MSRLDDVRDAYAAVAQRYVDLFGGEPDPDDVDTDLVRRHVTGLDGPVLDLGCGPGQWTALLHALGADVTGVDAVPAFVAHARATHPLAALVLGDLTQVDRPAGSVAGVLSWFSTIHLPPPEVPAVLAGFRRLLRPGGVLVLGFFGSDDGVEAFDHAVLPADRWPVDVLSAVVREAGFVEVERLQRPSPERGDRLLAALVARAA